MSSNTGLGSYNVMPTVIILAPSIRRYRTYHHLQFMYYLSKAARIAFAILLIDTGFIT